MSTLLITGQPGAGKTLYAVSEVLQKYVDQGRPLFVAGLEGLKLPYQPFPPIKEWTEERPIPDMPDKTAPFFCFPPDSVLVWDECQSIFPTRSTNSRAPDHVVAFTTHRKTGIDCVLITQRPKQMDSMLQGLVNEHRHIRRIWGMSRAVIYTWDQCSLSMTNYKEATRKVWRYPKKAYELYQSASAHTKPISKPPLLLYLVPILLILAAVIGHTLFDRVHDKTTGGTLPVTEVVPGNGSSQALSPIDTGFTSAPDLWSPVNYFPADDTRPESAPVYAGILKPVVAPVVSACVSSRRTCRCYTQQATRVGVPEDFCREFATVGRFDPYAQGVRPAAPGEPPGPSAPEQVHAEAPAAARPPGTVPLSIASAVESVPLSVLR